MIRVTDAAVIVNDEQVAIVPNTLEYDDGFGEQSVEAASTGGGKVEPVFSNDLTTNVGMCKFDMPATVENIALVRQWKTSKNRNLVQIAGETDDGSVTRSFSQAALINRVVIPLSSEGNISLEFASQPAI